MKNRLPPGRLALAAAVATACATGEVAHPKPVPAGTEPVPAELDEGIVVTGRSFGSVRDANETLGERLERIRRDMEEIVRKARPLPGDVLVAGRGAASVGASGVCTACPLPGDVLAFEESPQRTSACSAKPFSRSVGPGWLRMAPPADGAARLAAAAFPCGHGISGEARTGRLAATGWTWRHGTRPSRPSFPAVAK